MNKQIKSIVMIFIVMLAGCDGYNKKPAKTITLYQVKRESLHKDLHFSGTIQPLTARMLTSPMNAVIETMKYHFGERVKKNDVVLILNAPELQKQYNEVLTEYLKAKDAFTIAQTKFVGTKDLWEAGLLSKNNYLSEKSSVNLARVSLIQASKRLTEILEKMGLSNETNISELSLAKFEQVRAILNRNHQQIYVRAPTNGILLYPPKTANDDDKNLSIGSEVKAGDVLALIGQMNGIRVDIHIPEVDIDKVHVGMSAIVHSVVFPNQPLKGKLIAMNAQASAIKDGGLPGFKAIVQVYPLSQEEQTWVKVGMSADIELPIDKPGKLLVPQEAISLEEGKNVVYIRKDNGQTVRKEITTGEALASRIVVEQGLKSGDVLVYTPRS